MARERRVPRRRPDPPQPLGKAAATRHSLKGPGNPNRSQSKGKNKGQRVRAAVAAGYEDDEEADGDLGARGVTVPTRWVKLITGLLLLPVCWVLGKIFFDEFQSVAATNRVWAAEGFYLFGFSALLWASAFIGLPRPFIKFVAGLLLLPVCWVLSKTFFDEFHRVAERGFWATEEFYFFSLGALLWGITFVGLPRPLVLYVFGHEFTHALWVWIQGGEVSEFNVGRDGGYIIADRRDFLVSLAPYFFPFYSIVVIVGFGAAGHYYPWLWEYRRWLFAAVGATWAFHFTFTCWMIPKQQTDLQLHGTFFSLVVIYLANLCVLTILFITACPAVTWKSFGQKLQRNAADFTALVREKAELL